MSFSVNRKPKRLARRTGPPLSSPGPISSSSVQQSTDIYVMPYTEKSVVVMGDTLNHSENLVKLGGTYNPNLKIGQGWIFAKRKEESVRHYITTGEVKPYVYSQEEKDRFQRANDQKSSTTAESTGVSELKLRAMFREFRNAFDADEEYPGESIIDVIYQLEEKYLPKDKTTIKASTKKPAPKKTPVKKRTPTPTPEPEPEQQMEDEDDEDEVEVDEDEDEVEVDEDEVDEDEDEVEEDEEVDEDEEEEEEEDE